MDSPRVQRAVFFKYLYRRRSYVWLLCFLFLIQILDGISVQKVLPSYKLSLPIILSALAWSVMAFYLVCFLPWRWLRRTVAVILTLVASLFFVTDVYLLEVYHIPYTDATAVPMLATNPEEALGFFKGMAEYAGVILKALLSIIFVWIICWLLSFYWDRIKQMLSAFHARVSRCVSRKIMVPIVSICLLGGLILHSTYTLQGYKNNWSNYSSMSMTERVLVSYLTAQKEIELSNMDYHLAQADPAKFIRSDSLLVHNIVIVTAPHIYPALMHCYGYPVDNTPLIDKMLAQGKLIRVDSLYAHHSSNLGSLSSMLSYAHFSDSLSWDLYPSLSGVMQMAGYETYWLDNLNTASPSHDVAPQLANDCQHKYWVHLRGGEEYWSDENIYDEKALEHLADPCPNGKSLFQIVSLNGGTPSIWSRTPEDFFEFEAPDVPIGKDLDSPGQQLLAHYSNLILSQDWIFSRIIDHYRDTPSIVLYVGQAGAFGKSHPYSNYDLSKEKEGWLPLLIYVSPAMEEIRPGIGDALRTAFAGRISADFLPDRLTPIFGFEYKRE
ncbi:hypothetical protein HQ45_07205 [Porphyromonas crevioricanis]|uniref:sulfatase-like hydrolase/transferase n=1 Tax=Porphyromonas crevioricanis TaxID=393921 RepID=UPI00052C2076|nr:sulfatase-like hydrolase/transferase [Porphyromonas crevioricanis]KGN89320.1 hypothetical protein HQ45_07205 [Porphyromonas crevioricanis]